jgi:hypothetical protein
MSINRTLLCDTIGRHCDVNSQLQVWLPMLKYPARSRGYIMCRRVFDESPGSSPARRRGLSHERSGPRRDQTSAVPFCAGSRRTGSRRSKPVAPTSAAGPNLVAISPMPASPPSCPISVPVVSSKRLNIRLMQRAYRPGLGMRGRRGEVDGEDGRHRGLTELNEGHQNSSLDRGSGRGLS